MERHPRILVAPLDWGLGHATRCIPIINALLKRSADVIIAGNGSSAELLKIEFPSLKHCNLPGYNPQYPKNGSMVSGMAWQLPGFIKTIYAEHSRLNELVIKEKIDIVISDNRYGCYSLHAKSIFIGHQLRVLMPDSFKWMEPIVNHFNHNQLLNFDECWVPAPDNQLLGDLAPANLPFKPRYIGYLSRFKKLSSKNNYAIAAIASGPDPQRTMFADILRLQLKESNLKSVLVRGDVIGAEKVEAFGNYTEANYLNSEKLNALIEQSDTIVARSGYSSIMDLARLGKKAIFIPTPGQTEQAYLAARLSQQGIAFSMEQTVFNLNSALKEANKFSGFTNFGYDDSLLDLAIESII